MAFVTQAFEKRELRDPSWFRAIFANTWLAPLWLLARLYVGYQWILAGSHKVWGDNRWIARDGPDGLALKGFWDRATAIPEKGAPPIAYDWYRDFLVYMTDHGWYHWFAWVVGIGEMTVGVLLIVGMFTGLAALGGAMLNFNFMLAGTASTNPVMLILAVLLIFGWMVGGWMGVDRWVLPALGTRWEPGRLVARQREERERPAPAMRPHRGPA
jgi:thiosulfate dehydrogenase [quinone] large subunit